jgi:hypothetical protein
MRPLAAKIKPINGFSSLFHRGLVILLPIVVLVFVRLGSDGFVQAALSMVLLSKWRMFAVRPRFWLPIIRANSVDIIVGLSAVLFMAHSSDALLQIMWAVLYGAWLLVLKPMSQVLAVSAQAAIGQFCGLLALFLVWPNAPLFGLVGGTGLICYLAGRHFFDTFDEPYARLLAYLWAYFAAAVVWILAHTLVYYPTDGFIGQPLLLLSAIGYALAAIYYLDHREKLAKLAKQEILFTTGIIILLLVISLYINTRNLIS